MLNQKTKISNYNRNHAAGENCTIFNQRSYSYFRSFSLFIVSIVIKIDSSSIKIHALLDPGAFVCIIDKDFIDRHKLPLVIKKHPIYVEIIDGRLLVS
jgi:hypothetical protein